MLYRAITTLGGHMRDKLIEVSNLQKSYGSRQAVQGVSFTVEQGEIFGLLGPNGAGKTTTVECIEGLRKPDGGEIRVLGLDPGRDCAELRQRVGAQLQESELPAKMKVWEVLDLYASFYRQPADWRQLMESLGLQDRRNARFEHLSGGQKQRLSIALALVGNPEVAILDELTTGLDPHARRETWDLIEGIRERGVTVVLVTHFMEEAERLCDRIAVVDSGRVVAIDTPAGLVSRVRSEQRIRFNVSTPLNERLLTALPEVRHVSVNGSHVVVTGTRNLLNAVIAVLAGHEIVVGDLRGEQASLDDAFVALTHREFAETSMSTRSA